MTASSAIPPEFWASRYREGVLPWDLAAPAPPLAGWWQREGRNMLGLPCERSRNLPKMVVPGAGRGHDAAFFAREGLDVTGVDYTPEAVEQASRAYGDVPGLRFVQADWFDLPAEWAGTFDVVLEHTCFCAIHPDLRRDYARVARGLLRPGGLLVALFWAHAEPGGPPYGTRRGELLRLFYGAFDIVRFQATPDSVPARRGTELLAVLRRREGA